MVVGKLLEVEGQLSLSSRCGRGLGSAGASAGVGRCRAAGAEEVRAADFEAEDTAVAAGSTAVE